MGLVETIGQVLDSQSFIEGHSRDSKEDACPIGDKPFITILRVNPDQFHLMKFFDEEELSGINEPSQIEGSVIHLVIGVGPNGPFLHLLSILVFLLGHDDLT